MVRGDIDHIVVLAVESQGGNVDITVNDRLTHFGHGGRVASHCAIRRDLKLTLIMANVEDDLIGTDDALASKWWFPSDWTNCLANDHHGRIHFGGGERTLWNSELHVVLVAINADVREGASVCGGNNGSGCVGVNDWCWTS